MKLTKIRENLLVQELSGEVLIYDQTTNKSYCLNETAKTVFNACDGAQTFADVHLPEDLIYLSLDELKKQNLVEDSFVSPFAGMNRREVIRKVGLASMIALPVISSLVAPSAAQAASSCTTNNICVLSGQNICDGCASTRITVARYTRGTNCQTTGASPASFVCPANGFQISMAFDTIRTGVG